MRLQAYFCWNLVIGTALGLAFVTACGSHAKQKTNAVAAAADQSVGPADEQNARDSADASGDPHKVTQSENAKSDPPKAPSSSTNIEDIDALIEITGTVGRRVIHRSTASLTPYSGGAIIFVAYDDKVPGWIDCASAKALSATVGTITPEGSFSAKLLPGNFLLVSAGQGATWSGLIDNHCVSQQVNVIELGNLYYGQPEATGKTPTEHTVSISSDMAKSPLSFYSIELTP